MSLSLVAPCEKNRLPLFLNSLKKYKEFGLPEGMEFIIPTRTMEPKEYKDGKITIKIIKYDYDRGYVNPSMALNLGIRASSMDRVIITCPEVMPKTDVLKQFLELDEGNYVAQVFDTDQQGNETLSLVKKGFRDINPGMYFLAHFMKKDIETINGWDEDFMDGNGYEDDNFGQRFVRAGLKFEIKEDIQAIHQWHPRCTADKFMYINKDHYTDKEKAKEIRCKKGLVKE